MSSSITIVIVAVLIVLSTSSVMAQLSDANTLLLDGTKFGNSICYSSSSNLRKQTITLTQQPTAAVPILRLAAGPKQVISCIDLIEVQSGTDTSGGLCSSLASLRLCSGPLGSEPLSQTACTSINTVYTQPKATVIGGSLNDDDKEWSIRYDGTAYNDICFPRSVQVLVFAQAEGPGNGSIVLLIVVLVIVFAVLVCIMIYACYRFRRCVSQKNFDRAINVMPDGGANRFSQGGGGYENDIIIDEDGNEVRVETKASPDGIDDDQPPGLPQPGYRDIMMDDMANVASSPRNEFAVNDGPNIFRAGPIASIYGSDIQRDHYSVGAEPHQQQNHQSRGGPQYYGGGSNSRKSLSMYRVLPDVHMNPLPPPAPSTRDNNIRQYRVEPSQQSSLNINNNDALRDDNLQTDDSRSNANNNNDRVTICADCGMNVDANDCPQTCEITGKAHY